MPKVSVILPTYNSGRYLGQAIESVFSQTYSDFELIVVDDGSTDDTAEIVKRFNGRIRYHYQPHQERSVARNTGLKLASAKYVALLDSDDIWYSDRLERGVAALDQRQEIGFVHGEVDSVDIEGKFLEGQTKQNRKCYEVERKKGSRYGRFVEVCMLFSSTVIFRRSCLAQVGYYDERFPPREDYEWYLRFSLHYEIGLLERPSVAKYRVGHVRPGMRSPDSLSRIYVAIYEKHLKLVGDLSDTDRAQKLRSKILLQLACFHSALSEKQTAKSYFLQAVRLNPSLIGKWRLWKNLVP